MSGNNKENIPIRGLKVIKKPRTTPLPDVPINFPPLKELRLELVEFSKKLKPGLPLIPFKPPVMKPKPPPEKFEKEKKDKPKEEKPSKKEEKSSKKDEKAPKTKEEKPSVKKDVKASPKPTPKKVDAELKDLEDEDDEEDLDEEDLDEEDLKDLKEEEDLDEEDEKDSETKEEEVKEEDPDAHLTPEEKEAKEREEYLWRFRILKKQYKNLNIEDYNEHTPLQMMKTTYNRTVREIYMDESVESYRYYLMFSFVAIEYICTQYVGLDMSGFTRHQGQFLPKYDRLLIELGEKSRDSWSSNLPVELRLCGMVLMHAVMFYLAKIITDKFGDTVADLFKGLMGMPPSQEKEKAPSAPAEEPKRKMRGPSINAEDIKKMNQKDKAHEKKE